MVTLDLTGHHDLGTTDTGFDLLIGSSEKNSQEAVLVPAPAPEGPVFRCRTGSKCTADVPTLLLQSAAGLMM